MPYSYTLGTITWGANAPTANVTCTLRYRECPLPESHPVWVVVSANVIVQPNGTLAAPVGVSGLVEGQCYEFELTPNCGSVPKIKMIVVPAIGGVLLVTLYNELPAAPISQFRIDGNNMLAGALPFGDDANMDVTSILDGNSKPIAILLPSSEDAKFFHFKILRGVSTVVDEGYFQSSGVYETIASAVLQHSDKIYVRQANEHLSTDNYGDTGATVTGTCNAVITIVRTKDANSDASATNQTVRVNITATADNGCVLSFDVDFSPGDTDITGIPVDLSCNANPCATITFVVNSVTVLP